MKNRAYILVCAILALCLIVPALSAAADKAKGESKARTFWQKLFNYPANVTTKSVETVSDAGKSGTAVVTDEVKRVGQVTSGEFEKTQELVTEPVKDTSEAVVKAVKDTVSIPVEAAKEE